MKGSSLRRYSRCSQLLLHGIRHAGQLQASREGQGLLGSWGVSSLVEALGLLDVLDALAVTLDSSAGLAGSWSRARLSALDLSCLSRTRSLPDYQLATGLDPVMADTPGSDSAAPGRVGMPARHGLSLPAVR